MTEPMKCDCGGYLVPQPDAHLKCNKCNWVSAFIYYKRHDKSGIFISMKVHDVVRTVPPGIPIEGAIV